MQETKNILKKIGSDILLTNLGIEIMRNALADNVVRAEIIINEEVEDIKILDISKIDNNILKVFTQASKGVGHISNIRILNREGEIIIEKPRNIEKTKDHGLISTFMIELLEVENSGNVSIFDLSEVV